MRLAVLLISLLMIGLSGCGTMPAPTETASLEAREPFEAADYQLASGDRLRLVIYDENDLSGDYVVDGEGHVSLPLVGEIRAGGLTVSDFRQSVRDRLMAGYLKDPRVSIEVLQYRPFFILGEVSRPGTYPYQAGLTVLNAVATAEGFTYRANERVVYIRREGEEAEKRYPLTSTTPVRPGDTIRIGERFF